MLERAKQNATDRTQLFLMNAEALTFEAEQFEYVVLSHVISISKTPNQLISEAHRVLKPKGKLILLNHFTPNNFLSIIDYCFQPFAWLLHFNSYFKLEKLSVFNSFRLEKAINFGRTNYYQLLIFEKT